MHRAPHYERAFTIYQKLCADCPDSPRYLDSQNAARTNLAALRMQSPTTRDAGGRGAGIAGRGERTDTAHMPEERSLARRSSFAVVTFADVLLLSGTEADRAAEPIAAGRPFVLPTDQPWRALVQPEFGGMVELPLRPGRNAVEVPGPARVRCTTTQAKGALGDADVRFVLLRLRRDEPVLARIEDRDDEPPPPLPTTIAALRDDERDVTSTCTPDDDAPEGEFWISRRGHYAVFVVLQQNERNVLLAQPPVEFDVSAFEVELPIVIPLQPAALAAAREQLARDKEPR